MVRADFRCDSWLVWQLAWAWRSQAFSRFQGVNVQSGNILSVLLQVFRSSGQNRESTVMHGYDLFDSEKANRVSSFARSHSEVVADWQQRQIGFIEIAKQFHITKQRRVTSMI